MMNKSYSYLKLVFIICCASLTIGCAPKLFQTQETVAYAYDPVLRDSGTAADIVTFLAPYKASSDSLMRIVIGQTSLPLTKSQPESTMGNFVADAQLAHAQSVDPQVVGSVLNYGGLRIPYLAKGPITLGNIFEIMPFDNTLVIAEVPGSVVKQMCQLIMDKKGWPISGFIIQANSNGTVQNIILGGKTINDHIIYKIAISDYLANGGDDCEFFKTCKKKYYKTLVRDIMVQYLQTHQTIHPALTQRIVYE